MIPMAFERQFHYPDNSLGRQDLIRLKSSSFARVIILFQFNLRIDSA